MTNSYGDIIDFLDKDDLRHLEVKINAEGNLDTINSVDRFVFYSDPRFKKINTVGDLLEKIKSFDEDDIAVFFSDSLYNQPITTQQVAIIEKTILTHDGFIDQVKYVELS